MRQKIQVKIANFYLSQYNILFSFIKTSKTDGISTTHLLLILTNIIQIIITNKSKSLLHSLKFQIMHNYRLAFINT